MARAMLRGSQVLLMDEATSSVDIDTDRRIQELVRVEFKTRTILTIAHRLNTIIDYDKIVVVRTPSPIPIPIPHTMPHHTTPHHTTPGHGMAWHGSRSHACVQMCSESTSPLPVTLACESHTCTPPVCCSCGCGCGWSRVRSSLQIDAGHVAEMDTPQHLLQDPDSKFTALVKETGADSDAKLRAIAGAGIDTDA